MSDLLERIQVCKARWSMIELVEQLLGEPVPSSRKVHSPFNDADNSPSCHIYDDSFYCYSTGKYGDVVDLVREVRHCTVERAVQILEEEADELGLVQTVRTVAPKPVFVMPDLDWYPTVGCTDWYLSGVDHHLAQRLFVERRVALVPTGSRSRPTLAIVHYDPSGSPLGIKYRHGDGKKTSEPGSDFSSFLYQPFDYVTWDPGRPTSCVITEGETDSWAWKSVRPDDHVYSLPSGAQSWKDKFLEQLEGYDKVYLAFDHDTAGVAARDKVTRAVGWGRAEHVQFPTNYKDIREAVAAGWKPSIG